MASSSSSCPSLCLSFFCYILLQLLQNLFCPVDALIDRSGFSVCCCSGCGCSMMKPLSSSSSPFSTSLPLLPLIRPLPPISSTTSFPSSCSSLSSSDHGWAWWEWPWPQAPYSPSFLRSRQDKWGIVHLTVHQNVPEQNFPCVPAQEKTQKEQQRVPTDPVTQGKTLSPGWRDQNGEEEEEKIVRYFMMFWEV